MTKKQILLNLLKVVAGLVFLILVGYLIFTVGEVQV